MPMTPTSERYEIYPVSSFGDGGGGIVSGALSGLRGQDGESAAVAEQGAVQQALRRGGGVGL